MGVSAKSRWTAAALLVVVGLAGCSAGDGDPATPAQASAAAAELSAQKGEVQSFAPLAGEWQGVRKDVTVADCPTAAGDVTAQGTVVNSSTDARDISILVSWLAPDSSDPLLQLQQTLAAVPPGASQPWAVSGSLLAEAGRCVVGARSGALAAG